MVRYIIGIDLGTTNCCLSYIDTQNPKLSLQQFQIPQLTSPDAAQPLPMLPSFCYLPAPHEWPVGSLKLPWKKHAAYIVGTLAKTHGAKTPTRLVQSAKSWLSHTSIDRKDKILPFECTDKDMRISAVEATSRYLNHLREAWNHLMARGEPDLELEQQEVIVTVPASFDEIARALTAEAAKLAGFNNMTFLEEPQAAFYCWIAHHEKSWDTILKTGDCILVCDVGGGTTDFSLIDVVEKEGSLTFQRMAVGDHLLLGGDNMDAAIADFIEKKIAAKEELTTNQWLQLLAQARIAKETLMNKESLDQRQQSYSVLLQGAGSTVIQGSLSTELTKDDLKTLLLEGFFGDYPWEDAQHIKKGSGFRSMGLPYEEEPSITKHLAHFLKQAGRGPSRLPNYVLFNGGTMKPEIFQDAMIHALMRWSPKNNPQVLSTSNLGLAVGYGAAYYGKIRNGLGGIRISGGTPRAYYLGLNTQGVEKALTLLSRGSEEGATYEPDQIFYVMPNTPIAFNIYSSHVRLHDQAGDLIAIDPEEMHQLPPIHTLLRFGKKQLAETTKHKIPVALGIKLTAIGTLEIWLKSQSSNHQWFMEFQVRSASGQDNNLATVKEKRQDQTFDTQFVENAKDVVTQCFLEHAIKPGKVIEHLEIALQTTKQEWSPSLLRGLCEVLLAVTAQRKSSHEHEARWWNLSGFFLRPGYGYPLDDVRVKDLWKVILGDLKTAKNSESQIQQWICYRRIAGGLNKGQQVQLASELFQDLANKKSGKIELKNKAEEYQYSEKIRALTSMELIDNSIKTKIGNLLVERIVSGKAISAEYWALGRIGSRHLIYGSAAHVVPKATCQRWVEALLKSKSLNLDEAMIVMFQLARKTDHRELNLPENIIEQIIALYSNSEHIERLRELLTSEAKLTKREQEKVFGEQLPVGLSLES